MLCFSKHRSSCPLRPCVARTGFPCSASHGTSPWGRHRFAGAKCRSTEQARASQSRAFDTNATSSSFILGWAQYLDELDHAFKGIPDLRIIFPYLIEFASGVMLFPKLFRKITAGCCKLLESWISLTCFRKQTVQIMGFHHVPSPRNEKTLEIPLRSFVQ